MLCRAVLSSVQLFVGQTWGLDKAMQAHQGAKFFCDAALQVVVPFAYLVHLTNNQLALDRRFPISPSPGSSPSVCQMCGISLLLLGWWPHDGNGNPSSRSGELWGDEITSSKPVASHPKDGPLLGGGAHTHPP